MATTIQPTTIASKYSSDEKLALLLRLLGASAIMLGLSPNPNSEAAGTLSGIIAISERDDFLDAIANGTFVDAIRLANESLATEAEGGKRYNVVAETRKYMTDADVDALHPFTRIMLDAQG